MEAATPSLAPNSTHLCVNTWPLTLSMLWVLLLPQKEPGRYIIRYLLSNHMTSNLGFVIGTQARGICLLFPFDIRTTQLTLQRSLALMYNDML